MGGRGVNGSGELGFAKIVVAMILKILRWLQSYVMNIVGCSYYWVYQYQTSYYMGSTRP